jgi:LytR cell envelope-related transcriptional attenuator
MGRHSSPEQAPFYRSIIGWLLPWLMIAAAVFVAVWIAIDAVGQDDLKTPVASRPTPRQTESAEPSVQPSATPEPRETEEAEPKPDKTQEPTDELITAGISVQVLNGTAVTDADDRMASRLSTLGYEVVSVEGSSKQYPATTVFWSVPEAQEAAERLAARFGWEVGPKPENLSTTVDLHVVVGTDEA